MAFNKVLLAKQINGNIEYLYPKTTADMVLYTDSSTNKQTTIQDELDSIKAVYKNYETSIKNNADNIKDLDDKKIDMPIDDTGKPVDGTNGQILQSDDNGNVSWIDYVAENMLRKKTGNITVEDSLRNLDSETYFLRERKLNAPLDDEYRVLEGNRGQILQSDGDGGTVWVDYVPNGLLAVAIKGTENGGYWGYNDYQDRYPGQEVTVSGGYTVTPNTQITIQFSQEQTEIFQEKNLYFLPETRTLSIQDPSTGETTYKTVVVILAVGDIPENDYIFQVTATEVA